MTLARYHISVTDHEPRLIFDFTLPELREYLADAGMAGYRAQQVLDWVYQRHVTDPQQMSNLSRADRDRLGQLLRFASGSVVRHQRATDGVQKLLIQWPPRRARDLSSTSLPVISPNSASDESGGQTECVMIPAEGRKTACISSQVGCPVGCRFCASGMEGLDYNLTAGQIVEQVWRLGGLDGVERISNIVFMGMGEPLSNFDAVTRAIEIMMAPWGLGISGRRITVSTVGLPAQIRRLADLELPATLAISLHAPTDELRRQLIPWAEYVTIQQLLEAGRYYFDRTGREITLEYTLLRNVNDRPEHARALAQLAQQLRSHVNLIRYNEVSTLPYQRPEDNDVLQFQAILRRLGVNTHIRASRGRDIAAACGQLRQQHRAAV